MIPPYRTVWRMDVALLAEGVDRNVEIPDAIESEICRPPRGGRG